MEFNQELVQVALAAAWLDAFAQLRQRQLANSLGSRPRNRTSSLYDIIPCPDGELAPEPGAPQPSGPPASAQTRLRPLANFYKEVRGDRTLSNRVLAPGSPFFNP